MARNQKEPLHERIARQLGHDIKDTSAQWLPSLRELSRKYEVSLQTMWKATSHLKDRGILAFSQGKRMRVVPAGDAPAPADLHGGSATALYERIKKRISDGTYRAGQGLPKTRYFVLTEYCSNDTVCEALRMLEADRLIHKKRRRWMIGPPEPEINVRSPRTADRPVVVLVSTNSSYHDLFFDTHLDQFSAEFFSELNAKEIEYKVAFNDWEYSMRSLFPIGREGTLSLINSLGNRYQGALVMVHATSAVDLPEMLSWLCQFEKPVVWLDMDNKGPGWDRQRITRKNFFRCFSDERRAVNLAVDHLCEAGHKSIGFPKYEPYLRDAYFLEERIQHVRDKIAGDNLELSITVPPVRTEPWEAWHEEFSGISYQALAGIHDTMHQREPAARGARLDAMISDELLGRTPTLRELLTDTDVTAVLAANEWLAINYYYWLTYAGVSIPRDISIVAFDNYRRFMHHPIATVDLKLDELGYLAAHIFSGDIPVRHDRRGNIPARPVFVDRGSLGPPRTGPLKLPG
ncbi:MAG: GntR family transcriptional regulator [Chitinivibrionales bacterium]|nr:GntR family transcriptional regulator [Chitinivibrionales bacterium]MBD3394348.1 GntR family transcriptional regulator [Chitinivibrionales bacterium]